MTEARRTQLAFFFGKILPVLCLIALLALAAWISHHQNLLAGRKQHDIAETQKVSQIRIAATDDLKPALDHIIFDYRSIHPNTVVKATYGSSGALCRQISDKTAFDMFLSADVGYPRQLVERGLAEDRAIFKYATGSLALWIPNESKLKFEKHGISDLIDPSVKKISIADPAMCPYGQAAISALKKLGVYDSAKPRLVFSPSASQSAELARTGAADVAIIPYSIAMSLPMREAGSLWQVPIDAYPPIQQFGVILTGAGDPDATRDFQAFLKNNQTTATLVESGYSALGNAE